MTEVEKHTPGPWEVTDQNGDPEGSFRGVRSPTQINSLGKPYNTYVAQYCLPVDARVIAAAPDLLRELTMHVRNCPVCKGEGKAVDLFDMITTDGPYEKTDCKRCSGGRAAIAKATQAQP